MKFVRWPALLACMAAVPVLLAFVMAVRVGPPVVPAEPVDISEAPSSSPAPTSPP
ncbi:MAG TPA: hypothetical protein IAA98_04990, partial [Candidatus Avipropionibacterium avicola]|nr:hypothetical protein [Candidatus Avipropionibacterium avicola]